jgi:hypothetical protein
MLNELYDLPAVGKSTVDIVCTLHLALKLDFAIDKVYYVAHYDDASLTKAR